MEEEEQADEDKKTRKRSKPKNKRTKIAASKTTKPDHKKAQATQKVSCPSSVSLRQGVANLWPESQPPTLCAKR
jgi:hypothetical protein